LGIAAETLIRAPLRHQRRGQRWPPGAMGEHRLRLRLGRYRGLREVGL